MMENCIQRDPATPADDPDRRQLALLYRDLGWSVIPLNVGRKQTTQRWGRWQRELPPSDWIRKQWPPGSRRNIGVVCGRVSGGLVVRDWDEPTAYRQWSEQHPELKHSIPTVWTRRGCHQYLIAKDGCTSSLTLPDGELKGCGTYVVAPPSVVSVDRSGNEIEPHTYEWLVPLRVHDGRPCLPVVDLRESGLISPQFTGLNAHFTQHPQHKHAGGDRGNAGGDDPEVGFLVESNAITGPGQRNNALWRLAMDLKAHVDDPDDDFAERVLREWLDRYGDHCNTDDWMSNWTEFVSMTRRVDNGKAFLSRLKVLVNHVTVPEHMRRHRAGEKFDRILEVLVAADLLADGGTFYLSSRDLAVVAGDMTHVTAISGVKHARDLGFLRLVKAGTRGKRGRANEYQLIHMSSNYPAPETTK